jgi:hypothetical protein
MPSAKLSPMAQRSSATRRCMPAPAAERTGAFGRVGVVLLALLLLTLIVAPGAGAPAGSPDPHTTPATGVTGAHGKVSTDLLALADDRFLLPNQSRGEVVAALARSGHYAKAGQVNRGLGTPPVDLVEVYVRVDPGTGAAALRPFLHRVSAEDSVAGLVAGWVAPGPSRVASTSCEAVAGHVAGRHEAVGGRGVRERRHPDAMASGSVRRRLVAPSRSRVPRRQRHSSKAGALRRSGPAAVDVRLLGCDG